MLFLVRLVPMLRCMTMSAPAPLKRPEEEKLRSSFDKLQTSDNMLQYTFWKKGFYEDVNQR